MGKIGIRTRAANPNAGKIMYAPRANSFKVTREQTEEEAMGFPHGSCDVLQSVDLVTTNVKYNVSVGIESFDSLDIAFMMDEQISESTNATLPEIFNGIIPEVAPYSLAIADLIANQAISVTVLDSLHETRTLTQVAATPAAGEYSVGAGAVTFNAAEAGMPVNIMYDKVFATSKTLGLESTYLKWGGITFKGVVCGTRFPKPVGIFIPNMQRTGNWDLQVGQKATVELSFRTLVTPPYRSPIIFFDL